MLKMAFLLVEKMLIFGVIYFGITSAQLITQTKMDQKDAELATRMLSYYLGTNLLQHPEYQPINNGYDSEKNMYDKQHNSFSDIFHKENGNHNDLAIADQMSEGMKDTYINGNYGQVTDNHDLNMYPEFGQKQPQASPDITLSRSRNEFSPRRINLALRNDGQNDRRILLRGSSTRKIILKKNGNVPANIVLRGTGNTLRNIIVRGNGNNNKRIILKGNGNSGSNIIVRSGRGPAIRISGNAGNFQKVNPNPRSDVNQALNTVLKRLIDSVIKSQDNQIVNSLNSLNGHSSSNKNRESYAVDNSNNIYNQHVNVNNKLYRSNGISVSTLSATQAPLETTDFDEPEVV